MQIHFRASNVLSDVNNLLVQLQTSCFDAQLVSLQRRHSWTLNICIDFSLFELKRGSELSPRSFTSEEKQENAAPVCFLVLQRRLNVVHFFKNVLPDLPSVCSFSLLSSSSQTSAQFVLCTDLNCISILPPSSRLSCSSL